MKYMRRLKLFKKEEYQNCIYTVKWMDVGQDDIVAIMFVTKQMSIQEGMRKYKDEGKCSAMKEILILPKYDCFGETDYSKLIQKAKDKASPILMFMMLKRNGLLKTQGCANDSVQRLYRSKEVLPSLTPHFYTFKYICTVIAREGRDVAAIDLLEIFPNRSSGADIVEINWCGSFIIG